MTYVSDLANRAIEEMERRIVNWVAYELDADWWSQPAIKGLAEDITLSPHNVFAIPCTSFAIRKSGIEFEKREDIKLLIPRPDPTCGILITREQRYHALYHAIWHNGGMKREIYNIDWIKLMRSEGKYTRGFASKVTGAIRLGDIESILED